MAMSGGVDSSVAAALLVDQGYDVIGCTMQVWDYSKGGSCEVQAGSGSCCSSLDVDDAREVADKLEIPFYVINCEQAFEQYVIRDFVDSYLEGRTPIPCVNCNTFLKFDHLVKKMNELNCDYLATGHYAEIQTFRDGSLGLKTSEDSWKDQTYFLFTMQSQLLPKLLFPVGNIKKPDVRKIAEDKKLPVAKKKDSTGICFIGNKGYKNFIAENCVPEQFKPGHLRLMESGEILGSHTGIHNFTFGQRKGLGVNSLTPLYVIKIDPANGDVWLGEEKHLYSHQLVISKTNWLGRFEEDEVLRVKVRFAHQGAEARVRQLTDGGDYHIEFLESQRAITPGQAAVVYRGQQLLGGGWIQ